MDELISGLLQDARNNLDITFEDSEGDKKLTGILKRGITKLNKIAGESMSYAEESEERGLLFHFCRYERNGDGELFDLNYRPALVALKLEKEAARYAEKETAGTF